MLLFRGKTFVKSKVVCIDLHAEPNKGRYGDLIVLQMHQRGLAEFLLSQWLAASCCCCPNSHRLNCLPHLHWMQHYKRPKLTHTSENRNEIFLKSRGNTSFPEPVSVHNIARPNSFMFRLLSWFWKRAEYRTLSVLSSPENREMLLSAPRSFTLSSLQAQNTRVPFSSATNIANSRHSVWKDALLSVLQETEWQIPNKVKCRDWKAQVIKRKSWEVVSIL